MGIFDGIEDEAQRRGPECGVSLLRAKLDKADAAALERVLADHSIPGTLIKKRLAAAGHTIGHDTVQRHRRGACGCKA